MRLTIFKLISFFACLFFSYQCYAWNEVGHMIIANIAYQQLQPVTRQKVDKLIATFNTEYPAITNFIELSPWPDNLRSQQIKIFKHWHYIDTPFSNDGTPLKKITDTDNVLWALDQIEPIVKNNHANRFERARFLAFLIHLVGDIHQPLHAASRISAEHPDGDAGGNLFTVQMPHEKNKQITLHALWDNAENANITPTPEKIAELTAAITAHYPSSFFGSKATDLTIKDWADESADITKTIAYNTVENHAPTDGYMETKKSISEQRIALAGYRLANLLNLLLNEDTLTLRQNNNEEFKICGLSKQDCFN